MFETTGAQGALVTARDRARSGCQSKALPNNFGAGSTCHLSFQKWVLLGVFAEIHRELLSYYDGRCDIDPVSAGEAVS